MSIDFTRHIQYVCVMGEPTAGSEVMENEYNLVCSLSLYPQLPPRSHLWVVCVTLSRVCVDGPTTPCPI